MQNLLNEVASSLPEIGLERRLKSRISETFPAKMRAIAIDGDPISESCFVDNMSASGLYVRGPIQVGLGSQLQVIVHLFVEGETGSTVETTGKVVRVETLRDGSHGLAMSINRHRFL